MARVNFTKRVQIAVIKRATRDAVVYCEQCGLPVKKWHIDHKIADALLANQSRTYTADDGQLLCLPCHAAKTAKDVAAIAKAVRVEARHVGATAPKAKIPSRPKAKKERPAKLPMPPRRPLFEDMR